MPEVQNPHCTAHFSTKSRCKGLRPSTVASPSMVVTARPSNSTAKSRQAFIETPSTRMVQAPHSPSSQPRLVPVSSSTSRSRGRALISTGTETSVFLPFRTKSIFCSSDITQQPFRQSLNELSAVPRGPPNVGYGMDLLPSSRRGGGEGLLVECPSLEEGLGSKSPEGRRGRGAERHPSPSHDSALNRAAEGDRDHGDVHGGPGPELAEGGDEALAGGVETHVSQHLVRL